MRSILCIAGLLLIVCVAVAALQVVLHILACLVGCALVYLVVCRGLLAVLDPGGDWKYGA